MKLGEKIASLRKEHGLSREDVGKQIGTSAAIIERYERNEITPSVEVAAKIAETLEVSLDYLVGTATLTVKDRKMLYRLEMLEKISEEDKNALLKVMDFYLKEAQTETMDKKLS